MTLRSAAPPAALADGCQRFAESSLDQPARVSGSSSAPARGSVSPQWSRVVHAIKSPRASSVAISTIRACCGQSMCDAVVISHQMPAAPPGWNRGPAGVLR
jgi:hypothetical protein